MRPKRKEWTVFVPRPLPEVWNFFSRPENLEEMTPDHVSFNILSPIKGVEMYPGMVIQYTISPLLGIPMHWVTEVTQIRDHTGEADHGRQACAPEQEPANGNGSEYQATQESA